MTAAIDGLPQVYGDMAKTQYSTTTGKEPAYFPRIGEYWHSNGNTGGWNYNTGRVYVNPLSGGSFGASRPGTGASYVNNAGVLMDMDSLLHESAFTADKPKNTDRWEMWDGSLTFIPGEATNQNVDRYLSYDWNSRPNTMYGQDGFRGVFLDTDAKTQNFVQWTRYTPKRPFSAASQAALHKNALPTTRYLVNGYSSGWNSTVVRVNERSDRYRDYRYSYWRDYDNFVTIRRTWVGNTVDTDDEGNATGLPTQWGSETPLIWSQTRLHLQKAWLATSSQMYPTNDSTPAIGGLWATTGTHETQRQYLSGRDATEWW